MRSLSQCLSKRPVSDSDLAHGFWGSVVGDCGFSSAWLGRQNLGAESGISRSH
jgi:hypothetical protein